MSESELYKQLTVLTKDKDKWEESIPHVSSLLTHESVKIQAKALWLLGETESNSKAKRDILAVIESLTKIAREL